jgi:hypothetical protein
MTSVGLRRAVSAVSGMVALPCVVCVACLAFGVAACEDPPSGASVLKEKAKAKSALKLRRYDPKAVPEPPPDPDALLSVPRGLAPSVRGVCVALEKQLRASGVALHSISRLLRYERCDRVVKKHAEARKRVLVDFGAAQDRITELKKPLAAALASKDGKRVASWLVELARAVWGPLAGNARELNAAAQGLAIRCRKAAPRLAKRGKYLTWMYWRALATLHQLAGERVEQDPRADGADGQPLFVPAPSGISKLAKRRCDRFSRSVRRTLDAVVDFAGIFRSRSCARIPPAMRGWMRKHEKAAADVDADWHLMALTRLPKAEAAIVARWHGRLLNRMDRQVSRIVRPLRKHMRRHLRRCRRQVAQVLVIGSRYAKRGRPGAPAIKRVMRRAGKRRKPVSFYRQRWLLPPRM